MDAFTTPVDATITDYIPEDERELIEARNEVMTLKAEILRLEQNTNHWYDQHKELNYKAQGVKGVILDYISENGEVTDELKEIARILDMTLTKEIAGTAIYEITFTARVPLDFDADDIEITFDVDCNSYEAEDFDWNEDNCEVNAEEV
jgi:hypothetical protein